MNPPRTDSPDVVEDEGIRHLLEHALLEDRDAVAASVIAST